MQIRLLPVALACAVFLIVGCGGDDSGAGNSTAGTDLTVKMKEYEFQPREVTVGRGAVIHVTNVGQIAHNLKIERGPDPTRETAELAGTDSFLPEDSENLKIDLPPGRYVMVCTVPGHRELGMAGKLRVK